MIGKIYKPYLYRRGMTLAVLQIKIPTTLWDVIVTFFM